MKAIKGKILVKAYNNQKESIQIKGVGGKMIELWVGKKYVTNYRERNPVICEVIDNASKYYYIKTGDLLLIHHNYLSDPMTNPFCIEYDPQTGMGLYSFVANNNIFCKLAKDGKAIPVCENIIAERIKNPIKTSLIIVPDTVKQEHSDRVKVLAVAQDLERPKIGETVFIHKYADYEICYTFNKKEYSVIKVFHDDIWGS